ncbi:transposase-like protein, partial [Actimicrobium sp. GrIS 1.19]|nr:transposase-like protein [Actimicrobium sp. GrIS 1.19]
SWRMDETYIKVKGVWKYLYRAVDKQGKTVDFLLTAKRDMAAAKRLFDKAMEANVEPGENTAFGKNSTLRSARRSKRLKCSPSALQAPRHRRLPSWAH